MIPTVTLNPSLDRSVYVEKLLPHDTNRITKVETDVGGKGLNASRVLKELGSDTVCLGFAGGDIGRFIEHTLNTNGIPTDFVCVEGETRMNIDIQEASGAPPTALNESGPQILPDELKKLFAKVKKTVRQSGMIIFGGSLPPGIPEDTYARLLAVAKEAGAKTILDAEGEPMRLGMEVLPFMIKPNRDETLRLTGVDIQSNQDALRALDIFAQKGIELPVISMGARGAVARLGGEAFLAIPPKVKVVSTIGSGDSMVAGIAHILNRGGSLPDALRWGSAAGAATAMTGGTEIGHSNQILALLDKVSIEQIA
ncbi:MAG: 1-phosphofructokinase [Armatimonadota bacterium]|jgi:1-phosphofructokinase|nr:1-phosphofructokinase [Armatimonadota bacterium]